MSYFPSAREAARVLGVPLLLRENPDPRAFRRHDWLGTLAAPAASAARMYALALNELSRQAGGEAGAGGGGLGSSSAVWVTGPWGSLAHLPWAVGLADHLARTRGRAGLLEREPDGPLRTLARPGRRIAVRLPLAEALLGGPVDAVNTDLEGVSILLGRDEEARAGGEAANSAAGDFPLVLADGLPEALEGPYPGAEHVAGVILVASFRDHSRFELDAVVRRLRETGHRILGLTAIGPEVTEAEEAAALRKEAEADAEAPAEAGPAARGAVVLGAEARRVPPTPPVRAAVPEPESKPAPGAAPRPVPGRAPEIARTAGPANAPVVERTAGPAAAPEVARTAAPAGAPEIARAAASAGAPEVARSAAPAGAPEVARTAAPAASPEVARAAASVGTPDVTPAAGLARSPEAAPRVRPPAPPQAPAVPPAEPAALPPVTVASSSETGPEVPSARREERATISLLSTWDRMTIGRSRRRRQTGGIVAALLILAAAAAVYGVLLRPLLSPPQLTRPSSGESDGTAADGTDSTGAVAGPAEPVAADSTAPAAESTGTMGMRTGPAEDSTATAADTGRAVPDSGRALAGTGGAGPRRVEPGLPNGPAAGGVVDSGAVGRRRRVFGADEGAADTTTALPGGADEDPQAPFVIHLTSFKFPAEAEIEVTSLHQRGIEARSVRAEIPERGTWYRIVTGNFATFAEAESVALRLQAEGRIPYAHIAADGGRGQPVPVGTLDRARP